MNREIYAIQEIIDNFNALLACVDFTYEFEMLQVSKFQFRRRKLLLLELNALYIALWRFAMTHSFPSDGHLMFDSFLEQYTKQNTINEAKIIKGRISAYVDLLTTHGNNYMHVSAHILSFTKLNKRVTKAVTLRIALAIRQRYTHIFEKLI